MVKPIIIEKKDNIKEKISLLNFKDQKPVLVFDIHKTTLDKEGNVNSDIYSMIKEKKEDYNIVFLSFDGQEKRIIENDKLLNKKVIYRKIPRIFMKKREKHKVLEEIYKLYKPKKIMLYDDNKKNIKDVVSLNNKNIKAFHYKKLL